MLTKDQITAERFSACQARVCCQCPKCSWWCIHLSHGSAWISALLWDIGSLALPSCCEFHSFTDNNVGHLKVFRRSFLSLFTLSLPQGMSRWVGLADAFAEPDISTKRPFTLEGNISSCWCLEQIQPIIYKTKQTLSDNFSAVFWDRP